MKHFLEDVFWETAKHFSIEKRKELLNLSIDDLVFYLAILNQKHFCESCGKIIDGYFRFPIESIVYQTSLNDEKWKESLKTLRKKNFIKIRRKGFLLKTHFKMLL